MSTRYPSLALRRQTAKRRDQQLKHDVESAEGFDPNTPETPPDMWYADNLRPDIPGRTHGIVSVDPPGVQCDGCGYVHTAPTLALAVQFGPFFSTKWWGQADPSLRDRRRLCDRCATKAWRD